MESSLVKHGYYELSRTVLGLRMQARYRRMRRQCASDSTTARLDFDWEAINYNRISVINLLLAQRNINRYLEIGCADNSTFNSVFANEKIGVDPAAGGTHRMTSDAFFSAYRGEPFDVIFIDGLHEYRQAANDIRNSIKILSQEGWIVAHDLLPRDWVEEHVPRLSDVWTGDVWKCSFELIQTENVDFKIIAIDYGVGLLRPRRRNVSIPDLSKTLQTKSFSYLCDNVGRLPIISFDEARTWVMQVSAQPPEKV